MNHYPHHIGDFDKATRHLTRIERSIYRDLIELYYDTEERLTLDIPALCRKILARTNEEVTAVEQTLNEFFNETPTGWYHSRCELEIERYRANASQKAQAGKASAAAKLLKIKRAHNENPTAVEQPLNENPTAVEQTNNGASTNRKPLTVNQEPIKKHTAEYSAEFELAWAAYPRREGASKKDAFKAWSARLKNGVLPSVMIDGATRYAAYCKAQCTEQQYIKQPATFFGVGEHYLADWRLIPVLRRGSPPTENFESKNYGEGITAL